MAKTKRPTSASTPPVHPKFKEWANRAEVLYESPYPHITFPPSVHEAQNRALKAQLREKIPLADKGREYLQSQRKKAQLPRGKIDEDGPTIKDLVHRLATSPQHKDLRAKELWPCLYSELEDKGLDPKEDDDTIRYTDARGRARKITLARFKNVVSMAKSKKKSRLPG